MGRICSMHWGETKTICTKLVKERTHLCVLELDGQIILKWILEKQGMRCQVTQNRSKVGFCEHFNAYLCSKKTNLLMSWSLSAIKCIFRRGIIQFSTNDSSFMVVSPKNFHSSTVYSGNTEACLCTVLDLVSTVTNSLTVQNHTT